MAEVLVSPGIQITETDKSYVPARPLIAGAAIIGPTPKGAVNSPKVVNSYGEYQRIFGTTFMMNRYAASPADVEASASAEATAKYEANEEAKTAKEAAATTIENAKSEHGTLYVSENGEYVEYADQKADVLYFRTEVAESDPVEYTYEEAVDADTMAAFNAEVEDLGDEDAYTEKYVAEKLEANKLQKKKQEYLTSIAAKSYFEQGGDSLLVVRVMEDDFRSGQATIKNINGDNAFVIKTVSQGEYLNNWDDSEYQDRSETTESIENVIRVDGSLVSGSANNLRWEITDVDPETGTFSLYVRRGDDLDYDKSILEAFTGLSLDPDSSNYICRRIGDQHQVLVREDVDDEEIYYVNVIGNYPNVSNYIYIENVNDIYGYFLADGFTRQNEGTEDDVANKLPVQCEGGFKNASGKLFASDEDEANAAFFEDIKIHMGDGSLGIEPKIQGVDPAKYQPAIAVLENQDEYQINMIAAPGLTADNAGTEVDMLVALASRRGDLIAVVDLVGFGASINEVKQQAIAVNSNYAATYWPWLQMYSSTGRLEWVPASTIIEGVYTFTDHISAPWFAPAGMTRGSVQGVVQPERKLLKQHRDELYKKNVNPISILPGNGITIYGQKTLQKKATALDRVNVRRLMIELKKHVKDMASGILFEHNTKEIRNQFKGALDSYLESVVQRRGLYAYKTIVDEINTPDVIDRNEFQCQIYVQPTKVIEFIYINFTITNTGVEFND